jgi:hypothetical protein
MAKAKTHAHIEFVITSRLDCDGYKTWGFYVPSLGRGQSPTWHRKKDAVESAKFHIDLWLSRR